MKLATIEKYVKYSTIPYPEIINRAVKAGWIIVNQDEKDEHIHIHIKNPDKIEHWETCYYKNDSMRSAYNIYTP